MKKAENIMVSGAVSSPFLLSNIGLVAGDFTKGQGAILYDDNNKAYTDYHLNNGSFILGHSNKGLQDVLINSLQQQQPFYAASKTANVLADKIIDNVAAFDQLLFFDGYASAIATAIRLARSYAARKLVVMFSGSYHGANDELITDAGAGVADLKHFAGPGVPQNKKDSVVILPYNDTETFEQFYNENSDEIAAVIVEPIVTSTGIVYPKLPFLQKIKQRTENNYAVLIFDESRTAFRSPKLFAQLELNIQPDLTIMGSSLANGLPIAALAGRNGVMKMLRPKGSVYHDSSSSFGLSLAAANYVWGEISAPNNIENIKDKTDFLNKHIKTISHPEISINTWGMAFSVFLHNEPVSNFELMKSHNKRTYRKLYKSLFDSGLFLTPSYYSASYVSTTHNNSDLQKLKMLLEQSTFC